MHRITHFRLFFLVLLLAAFAATRGDAQSSSCKVLGSDGMIRDCTFTEELGKCAWEAFDSWKQCVARVYEEEDGTVSRAWGFTKCDIAYYIDLTFCGIGTGLHNAVTMH